MGFVSLVNLFGHYKSCNFSRTAMGKRFVRDYYIIFLVYVY